MSDHERALTDDLGADSVLSAFDARAVAVVSGLLSRIDEAREAIAEHGVLVDGRENPACLTERTASAELRGWVKERPDLFGKRGSNPVASNPSGGLKRFKVVE